MVLKKIGAFSLARIMAVIYACFGLLVGIIISFVAMVTAGILGRHEGDIFGFVFGASAFIIFPIVYCIIGFIAGLLVSGIYNVAAGLIGGIEMEFEQEVHPAARQYPSA